MHNCHDCYGEVSQINEANDIVDDMTDNELLDRAKELLPITYNKAIENLRKQMKEIIYNRLLGNE